MRPFQRVSIGWVPKVESILGPLQNHKPTESGMARVSRRQTLGLGLGAGLSVTMLSGHEEAQAAPTNTTFSLLS